MGAKFWTPLSLVSLFFFLLLLPPSSFLPPLTLFIFFFPLIFLLHLTISFSKKHFSKLLNLPLLISLNTFLDPCVLEYFCYTPIFGETHFQTHLLNASKCHFLPMDPLFSLLMARNIIHHLNGMMRRGSFKTPRPILHIPIWTLR